MRARDAIKLHKGDEVKDKETGESIYVIDAYAQSINDRTIIIEGTGQHTGYNQWSHTQVR